MVLLVHGGPWAQDVWGYSPEVQLLANRGYAVLQVNYRGSTGYGKSFTHAAEGEFGGRCTTTSSTPWLGVAEGVADPDRVAIYGGSYGGYAALCGVTLTPTSSPPPSPTSARPASSRSSGPFPAYWRPFLQGTWFRYVGDPGTEDEPDEEVVADLLARSPLSLRRPDHHAADGGQGANDPA
jgi:pimeloyl-ACP methyl ester carboxylesterase